MIAQDSISTPITSSASLLRSKKVYYQKTGNDSCQVRERCGVSPFPEPTNRMTDIALLLIYMVSKCTDLHNWQQ